MDKKFGHLSPRSGSGFSRSMTEMAYEKLYMRSDGITEIQKKTANVFQFVNQKSGEERSTCYTVTVPLHHATIFLP